MLRPHVTLTGRCQGDGEARPFMISGFVRASFQGYRRGKIIVTHKPPHRCSHIQLGEIMIQIFTFAFKEQQKPAVDPCWDLRAPFPG